MKTKKLGVGIIGCGAISENHINGYLFFKEQCEIKAVADLFVEKGLRAAALAGKEVKAYERYQEMLERDDIDIISVCTPPYMHREHVIASLAAGKHVLCEKPFAPSLEDCDAMIAEAERRHLKLAVVFQYRYRKDFKQIRHILDSNVLGPIVFAQMNGLYWRGDLYYDVPWRGKFETECGGVTMNHAIHPLDIFVSLMGEIESIIAETTTEAHNIEVEDTSFAAIRFKNGALAHVNCTLNSVCQDISMTFSGKYKSVGIANAWSVQPLMLEAVCNNSGGFAQEDVPGKVDLARIAGEITEGSEDHSGPINDLIRAIRGNNEPSVNGREGRRSIEAITAIYKSATLGTRVMLPITTDDPWYTRDGLLRHVKRSPRSTIQAGRV